MGYFWVAAGSHIQLEDKVSFFYLFFLSYFNKIIGVLQIIFSFFLVGAIFCMGMSAVFHTVSCHSKAIVHLFSRLPNA
jgi:predicted membrane channel-forming protein YqfA (hemolysin III family)